MVTFVVLKLHYSGGSKSELGIPERHPNNKCFKVWFLNGSDLEWLVPHNMTVSAYLPCVHVYYSLYAYSGKKYAVKLISIFLKI